MKARKNQVVEETIQSFYEQLYNNYSGLTDGEIFIDQYDGKSNLGIKATSAITIYDNYYTEEELYNRANFDYIPDTYDPLYGLVIHANSQSAAPYVQIPSGGTNGDSIIVNGILSIRPRDGVGSINNQFLTPSGTKTKFFNSHFITVYTSGYTCYFNNEQFDQTADNSNIDGTPVKLILSPISNITHTEYLTYSGSTKITKTSSRAGALDRLQTGEFGDSYYDPIICSIDYYNSKGNIYESLVPVKEKSTGYNRWFSKREKIAKDVYSYAATLYPVYDVRWVDGADSTYFPKKNYIIYRPKILEYKDANGNWNATGNYRCGTEQYTSTVTGTYDAYFVHTTTQNGATICDYVTGYVTMGYTVNGTTYNTGMTDLNGNSQYHRPLQNVPDGTNVFVDKTNGIVYKKLKTQYLKWDNTTWVDTGYYATGTTVYDTTYIADTSVADMYLPDSTATINAYGAQALYYKYDENSEWAKAAGTEQWYQNGGTVPAAYDTTTIPSPYTKLSGLVLSRSNTINLGYYPKDSNILVSIVFKFSDGNMSNHSSSVTLGNGGFTASNMVHIAFNSLNEVHNTGLMRTYYAEPRQYFRIPELNNTTVYRDTFFQSGTTYNAILDNAGTETTLAQDTRTMNIAAATGLSSSPIYLGGRSDGYKYLDGTVYAVVIGIKENGQNILQKIYVPAKDDSDNEGLYEIIDGEFKPLVSR
jgi:hypothetical protein